MSVSGSERAYRILAVDDELDILTIIKMSLERYNHKVDTFSNPLKALSHFEKNPAYDLVITDIRMPYMTGYELASRLRAIDPGWVKDPRQELSRIIPARAVVDRLTKGLAAAGLSGGS